MNFSEYQDAVLATDTKPCKSNKAEMALWVVGGRCSPEKAIRLLGIVLKEITAIATDLDLDLNEIAEASLKSNE